MEDQLHLQYTGKKNTVAVTIEVLIEIDGTNSYAYDEQQAKEALLKRIIESPTFLPMRARTERMYYDVKVQELKNTLMVHPRDKWGR